MMFECVWKTKNRNERWSGTIERIKDYGSHYELQLKSRSSIRVIIGPLTGGAFACMPDFNVGCHLSNLNDMFWNTERLTKVLGKVDGITVAYALRALANKIHLYGS